MLYKKFHSYTKEEGMVYTPYTQNQVLVINMTDLFSLRPVHLLPPSQADRHNTISPKYILVHMSKR